MAKNKSDLKKTVSKPISTKKSKSAKSNQTLTKTKSETIEKKPKLSLKEKQAIKLKIQKEREAAKLAKSGFSTSNTEKYYCKNKDLMAELIKWRDSAEKVEDRVISNELGQMLITLSEKILNHSNFRNYSKDLKADMQSFFYYKAIKGLKNYNFEFNNPFAWFSMAAFNAYLTIISRHYKHLNIKRDLMEKMLIELNTYPGINTNSSLTKHIKQYLADSGAELGDSQN